MASQLSRKVAIITGASGGIGEAIAAMFASRGAKVTLCGRDEDRLRSVMDKVVKVSGDKQERFLAVPGDLNDQRVRKEIVDKTIEKFGRLDILVPNAGVTGSRQSVAVATEETFNKIVDTNFKSVFFLIQQAVPHLEMSKGNIINISSIATTIPFPAATIYACSKIAIDHLTRVLAVDLGPKGIRVNTVNPGYVPTRIMRHHGDKEDEVNVRVVDAERNQQPLASRGLTLTDVAEIVTFLASDAAGFITGEDIRIDGGRAFSGVPNWSAQK